MARILPFRRRREEAKAPRAGWDARVDELFPSDARPADEPVPGQEPDPEVERKRRAQRLAVLFVLVFVFVLGCAATAFGSQGWLELRRARAELRSLTADVEVREARVEDLRREVQRLRTDPTTIARVAREDLGFSEPGEITILLPPRDRRGPNGKVWLPPPAPKRADRRSEAPRD